jgi:predicted CXXCH cytochrome family protein
MCHAIEADLYVSSPHYEAFAAQGLPMCETCHSNHGIGTPTHALIGLEEGQLCGNCHTADDGTAAPLQIDSMSTLFAALTKAVDSSRYLVGEAAVRGMMVTDKEFTLKEIDQILIHMRSSVHAFNVDSLTPYATEGLEESEIVQAGAAALIDEYYFRRWGLGIASFLITLLAIGIYLKIRTSGSSQT